MAENKSPFTGLLGLTSFNDGAVMQTAIMEGATPYCLTPNAGGYSGQLYIPVGGSSTIRLLLGGPPPVSSIHEKSWWCIEFGAADINGNEIFSGNQYCGYTETTLNQQFTAFYTGKRYIVDSNFVINNIIFSAFRNSLLLIRLWELNR